MYIYHLYIYLFVYLDLISFAGRKSSRKIFVDLNRKKKFDHKKFCLKLNTIYDSQTNRYGLDISHD